MPVSAGYSRPVRCALPLLTTVTALTASLLAGPLVAPVRAQTVVFTSLDVLPGSPETPSSAAHAVSAEGKTVVGTSYFYHSSREKYLYQAVRWSNGQVLNLGVLPNETDAFAEYRANGVSADGKVIVGERSSSPIRAWRWENGKMVGLGVLSGYDSSRANGVSADGKVAVGYGDSTSGTQAFRWENGQMTGLGFLQGGDFSNALAISANGKVVVGLASSSSGYQGFRWANGQMAGLGIPSGQSSSIANAVSDTGRVVVGESLQSSGSQSWRWENGQIMALPYFSGGQSRSSANGVSGDGQVVVSLGYVAGQGDFISLWRADLGTVKLEDFLRAHNVSGMDGFWLNGTPAISADGSTIVGTAYNSNTGETRGFSLRASNPGGFRTLGYAGPPAVLGRVMLQGLASAASTRSVSFELRPLSGGGQPITFTRDISTAREDQSFTFVVPAGRSGTFNLAIQAPGYLRRVVRVQIGTSGGAAISDVTLLPGDVNGDNQINLTDLMQLRANLGKSGVGLKGDVNGDGKVDNADVALIQQNFGKQGQQ